MDIDRARDRVQGRGIGIELGVDRVLGLEVETDRDTEIEKDNLEVDKRGKK